MRAKWRLEQAILCLIITLFSSCAVRVQRVFPVISDAKAEISLAEQAEAKTLASRELDEAKMLISQADAALQRGDVREAERLAERALLTARYARLLASYKRLRREIERERMEIEALRRDLESARRMREAAESELKRLTGGEGR